MEEPFIFLSTGAFGKRSVPEILGLARQNGFQNIELSSGALYQDAMLPEILAAKSELRFLVHNYFPTPEKPFVLNLASDDPETLELSRRHCRKAIDLCVQVGAPFYSVHTGFCFHARPDDLGQKQTELKRISKAAAEEIFIASVTQLADYAAERGIALAIENNVFAPFNLEQGKNNLLLGVTAEELLDIFENADRKNLGLLLDVAHLKVSAKTLGFDPEEFIRQTAPFITAVHLSDNDGTKDNNQPVRTDSWFWKPLLIHKPFNRYWILEAYNLTPEKIAEQIQVIQSKTAALVKP